MPCREPLKSYRRLPSVGLLDVAGVAFIVLLATAFLALALRPDYTLLPLQWVSHLLPWSTYIDEPLQNTTLGDPFFAFYPRRLFFTEAIRSGELPFWNPYVLGGYPAVGDTNAQTFYPPNWLAAFFLSPARSFSVLAWFHLALTGVLMFALLRAYRLHPSSSLVGAISWMLSGILVVWLEHPHRLSSFAWLPGLFWLFHVGEQRRRLVFPVLGGLVFSLMILGGQPQYAALGGLLLGLYALSRCVRVGHGTWRWAWWPLLSLAIVAAIGLGLGALQLFPTYEFLAQSHRQPRDMELLLSRVFPLRHLTTFWLPDFLGSAEVGRYPYWGQSLNYVEYTFYFGALPFVLSLLAPILGRERRVSWLWSAVIALTILIAIGSPFAFLVQWIPGMSYFCIHRMMSPVPFLGSWMAALALDGIVGWPRDRRVWPWLLTCGGVLLVATGVVLVACRLELRVHWAGVAPELVRQGCVLALGFTSLALVRRWRRVGLVAAVLVVTCDLFLWGRTFNPVSELDLLYPRNEVTDWLEQDTSLYRVLPLRDGERVFGENVLAVFHISAPDGYLAMTLRHHKELMYTIDPYFEGVEHCYVGPHVNLIVAQDFHPLHSMLNVKYVLSSVPLGAASLRHVATLQRVYIYENPDMLPRAYVVHRARVVPEAEVLDVIVSPGWDFRTEVVISEPLTPRQQAALADSPVQDRSYAHITRYAASRIRLAAHMGHAGWVVVADPFSLGWRATVDGRPAEIVRANHALRALFLDAGDHDVELTYRPKSVIIGASIAAVAFIVGLALVILDFRGRGDDGAEGEGDADG